MKNTTMKRAMPALALLFYCAFRLAAQGADAVEILRRTEKNQVYSSIIYEGKMEIFSGTKVKVKTMQSWSAGSDRAFIEFASPQDKGVRMLKLGDTLLMYFPKERDTVKISGALLSQGMMGSDLSYEDAMQPDSLLEAYEAALDGKEIVDGRSAFVITLKARKPDAAYAKRILWIDAERYITLKSEFYARSGMLLKTSRTLGYETVQGRIFPSIVEIADAIKKNSRTVFTMTSLKIDVAIDPKRFSLQELSK